MTIFVDYLFNHWLSLKSCVNFFLQLLSYNIDFIRVFDMYSSDFRVNDGNFWFLFFLYFDKFLPPILIYIRLSLPGVYLENRRRGCGYHRLFLIPPCSRFLL